MNIKIVAKRANGMANPIVQDGFLSDGLMIHPRSGRVGANALGTINFGVDRPTT